MNTCSISEQHNKQPIAVSKKEDALFYKEIMEGLRSEQKYLPSKYFYDEAGDRLFQDIMKCDEYYLFDCEHEIFSTRPAELSAAISRYDDCFDLIELGPGDCTKSGYLLKHLVTQGVAFNYLPVDISTHIIEYLKVELGKRVPGLQMTGLNGDYGDMLGRATAISGNRKVVLFLGSNLGNMLPVQALSFSRKLRSYLQPGDMAVIGLDLKKDPRTILAAYNDKKGITREFNLNLLTRINRELNANFNRANFEHYPTYDPATGSCKSYLVSLTDQVVYISGTNGAEMINFKKGETIFMEVSQKYTTHEIAEMAQQAGFKATGHFQDSKGWFVNALWEAV
jgi:dimethylhistidine N-methyltransferase